MIYDIKYLLKFFMHSNYFRSTPPWAIIGFIVRFLFYDDSFLNKPKVQYIKIKIL